MKQLPIDEIMLKVSYQLEDGTPNFARNKDTQLLKEVLIEMGFTNTESTEISDGIHTTAIMMMERESPAAELARKKGYDYKGRGYWQDKSGKVVAKTVDDKLIPIKKTDAQPPVDKKTAEKPSVGKKDVKTSLAPEKDSTQKKAEKSKQQPIEKGKFGKSDAGDDDSSGVYAQKSEISKGLFAREYKIINGTEVRNMLDENGSEVDVTSVEGRKTGINLIQKRINKQQQKIITATELLTDKDKFTKFAAKTGENSTVIYKWLGEIGELKLLQSLLQDGREAYLLTDSAPKNDIVVVGSKSRGIQLGFISVKTTKGNTNANKRGANCKSDFKMYIHESQKKTLSVGVKGKKYNVSASTYVNATIDVKSFLIKSLSKLDGVCRNGIPFKNPKLFLPTAKDKLTRFKAGDKNVLGFTTDMGYLRNRILTEKDALTLFNDPKIKEMYRDLEGHESDPAHALAVHEHFKEDILSRIKKSSGKFTLGSLFAWEDENIGNAMVQTDMPVFPTADTAVANFEQGKPDLTVSIVPKEKVAKEVNNIVGQAKNVKNPLEKSRALVKATGLSQRVRKLGNKDNCQGHLDGIDNLNPTVDVTKMQMSVPEYTKQYLDKK